MRKTWRLSESSSQDKGQKSPAKEVRKSEVFPTRQEAKDWAAREEFKILNGEEVAAKMTLGEVFDRNAREASLGRRGARWETVRLEKFQRDPLAKTILEDLVPEKFAKWRDARLRKVAPASVIREMQLMSSVLNTARREWGLIAVNPLSDVRKPSKPPPRDRLPTQDEIDRMRHCSGEDSSNATARAFHAFLLAEETGMRAGEIAGLEWDRVDLKRRVARLPHTKNGSPRDVPLCGSCLNFLNVTIKVHCDGPKRIFCGA